MEFFERQAKIQLISNIKLERNTRNENVHQLTSSPVQDKLLHAKFIIFLSSIDKSGTEGMVTS